MDSSTGHAGFTEPTTSRLDPTPAQMRSLAEVQRRVAAGEFGNPDTLLVVQGHSGATYYVRVYRCVHTANVRPE